MSLSQFYSGVGTSYSLKSKENDEGIRDGIINWQADKATISLYATEANYRHKHNIEDVEREIHEVGIVYILHESS